MDYIIIAHIVVSYIVMACIIMAYIVMAVPQVLQEPFVDRLVDAARIVHQHTQRLEITDAIEVWLDGVEQLDEQAVLHRLHGTLAREVVWA